MLRATRHQQRHGGRLQSAIRGESADTGISTRSLLHPSLWLCLISPPNMLDPARYQRLSNESLAKSKSIEALADSPLPYAFCGSGKDGQKA